MSNIIPGPKVTVTLKAITKASDGLGGYVDTLTTVGIDFKAVLTPSRGNESLIYSKEIVVGDYLLYSQNVPSSVKEADVIIYATRTFNILFVGKPFLKQKYYFLSLEEVK